MQRLTLELELVTPCFLGGASPEAAEWRAASVRGQLRWWFRAVVGGRVGPGPEVLRTLEAAVFGSTERQSALMVRTIGGVATSTGHAFNSGKSAADLGNAWGDDSQATARRLELKTKNKTTGKLEEIASNPLHYLAYGPFDKGKIQRSYLAAGKPPLQLQLTLRRSLPVVAGIQAAQLLAKALWCWLHLGGIGARSRRGYGSLSLVAIEGELAGWPGTPVDRDSFRDQLEVVLGPKLELLSGEPLPEWTFLTQKSSVLVGTKDSDSWREALALAGSWLMAFRRRYGMAGDARSQGSVADRDYAWVKGRATPAQVPDRAGFGLPLGFGKLQKVALVEAGTAIVGSEILKPSDPRRASPLLLHVMKLGTKHWPVLTYLPARLVADGRELALVRQKDPNDQDRFEVLAASSPTPQQDAIAASFLSDLASPSKGPLVQQVWP